MTVTPAVATNPETKLAIPFNGDLADISSYGVTVTADDGPNNDQVLNFVADAPSGSTATNSLWIKSGVQAVPYVAAADAPSLNTGDFCLETWVKYNLDAGGSSYTIISRRNNNNNDLSFSWLLRHQ